MSENAISLHNICKSYHLYDQPVDRLKQFLWGRKKSYFRVFHALKDVSFDIPKGKTVGIIGRNGAGKSTLLQIIAGTLTPTSGSVQVNGRVAALLELGSGFNPEFTGRENIYMNAAILGLTAKEAAARYDHIVAFADIGDFIEQPVKTYSSGMLMRLAFSVAISVEPEILIVDEALSVGDMAFQFKCVQRLDEMARSGVTILFVSHSLAAVRSMCEHVIYLRNGEVRAQGRTADVIELYMLDLREDQRRDAGEAHALKMKKTLQSASQAFGTDQGRITAAAFTDGSNFCMAAHGDEVTFLADLEFDETVTRPEVAILVQDRRSVAVSGTYLGVPAAQPGEGTVKRKIACRLPARFSPGKWFITIVLRNALDEGLKLPIDKQVAALTLEVTGDAEIEYIGLASLGIQASLMA